MCADSDGDLSGYLQFTQIWRWKRRGLLCMMLSFLMGIIGSIFLTLLGLTLAIWLAFIAAILFDACWGLGVYARDVAWWAKLKAEWIACRRWPSRVWFGVKLPWQAVWLLLQYLLYPVIRPKRNSQSFRRAPRKRGRTPVV